MGLRHFYHISSAPPALHVSATVLGTGNMATQKTKTEMGIAVRIIDLKGPIFCLY
jgi:hypothetical protein